MTIPWFAGILLLGTFLPSVSASEFSKKIRASYDSENLVPTEIFKIRDLVEVHYFAPASPRILGNNPAQIYIHGGAWKGGSPTSSYHWCRYLAEHGVSAFTIRYQRSNEAKGIKPTECLKDTKTAMRWLRSNAKRLGINPNQIAAAGNSAGGHLATALATIEDYNAASDDLSISCRPDLLLLSSPVIDNGLGGYGNGWDETIENKQIKDYRVKDFWKDFSPVHNLNHTLPPSLVLMGDQDPLIRIESVNTFGQAVEASGSDFQWIVFPKKGHGLFRQTDSYLTPELVHIYYAYHQFLAKHGYIDPPLPAGDEVRALIRKQPLSVAH